MTRLTTEQQQFVTYRLAGMSIPDIAKTMGMNERRAYRWAKHPAVERAINKASEQMHPQETEQETEDVRALVVEGLKKLAPRALEALEESLDSSSALAKFQAVQLVIDRIAPEEPLQTQVQNQDAALYDASLTSYMEPDELDQLERIVTRAQQRKQEAEEKITPIRKQA